MAGPDVAGHLGVGTAVEPGQEAEMRAGRDDKSSRPARISQDSVRSTEFLAASSSEPEG